MKDLLSDASSRAARYLADLETRSVAPTPGAIAALKGFEEALPEKPCAPAETLRVLDEIGSPATSGMAGPRFFGFVIGGSLPAALAANYLAGAWDQNAVLYRATPGVAVIEQVALRWLLDVLRLPPTCGAAFVTGATVANLCALAAARHSLLARAGWNVESDGLFGAPPITVVVGAEVHPSVTKSLGVLGLGRNRVVKVPVDSQGRMIPGKIPPLAGPTIVVLQ
ncbi:MAG: pyridoxal-dependent decarboxylase, partial [Verrucomicrobia bacterium]|nr:pyridoxal-dependent decarboxylase [Verrucomicrobiota bacterium]